MLNKCFNWAIEFENLRKLSKTKMFIEIKENFEMFCKWVWVYKYRVVLTISFDAFKQDYWVMLSKCFIWVTWVEILRT